MNEYPCEDFMWTGLDLIEEPEITEAQRVWWFALGDEMPSE